MVLPGCNYTWFDFFLYEYKWSSLLFWGRTDITALLIADCRLRIIGLIRHNCLIQAGNLAIRQFDKF